MFDIDGVLADSEWRLSHIQKTVPPDWTSYNEGVLDDDPLALTVWARILASLGVKVILLTNRDYLSAELTSRWLAKHEINYHKLLMRNDPRIGRDIPYPTFKYEMMQDILEEYEVLAFFEDKPEIVTQCRSLGVPTYYIHSGHYDGVNDEEIQATEKD